MSDDPEELDWLAQPPTVVEAIEDLRGVIDDLDDVRPDEMTDFFYVHAYNMLIETARTLIQTLDQADMSARTEEWPWAPQPQHRDQQPWRRRDRPPVPHRVFLRDAPRSRSSLCVCTGSSRPVSV